MGRIVHFEIHASDPDRAVAFYTGVFGWQVTRMGDMEYWLLSTGADSAGIDGAVLRRQGEPPAAGAPVMGMVNTAQVEDLDAALARVDQLGGQLAVEKMPVPNVGVLAYVLDTEGNVLGLLEPEAPAA